MAEDDSDVVLMPSSDDELAPKIANNPQAIIPYANSRPLPDPP